MSNIPPKDCLSIITENNEIINCQLNNSIAIVDTKYNRIYKVEHKQYDAIKNCKSAGIIPYTIVDDVVYFLLQKSIDDEKKKLQGWNDFGGKRISSDNSTIETAAREFSEETSCLFYLFDQDQNFYQLIKNNHEVEYDAQIIKKLGTIIPDSTSFFAKQIQSNIYPMYTSCKEIYISYFLYVPFVPASDIPRAEDIHIFYEKRFMRRCKWISLEKILKMKDHQFHKRLQITKIKQKIIDLNNKSLFT